MAQFMTDSFFKYYDNKVVRSLIQLVPLGIGSAADVFIKESIENIRKERLITFFNQLEEGEIILTDEVIKSEDFLHNYFSTIKIVLNTKRREKINLIGTLFNFSTKNELLTNGDIYELYLKVLDELTFQEIEILFLLYDLETKTSPQNRDKTYILSANREIWQEFKDKMLSEFNIDNNSLDAILIRIERTGCLYVARTAVNDGRITPAMTTNIFKKLMECLKVSNSS